MDCPVCLKAPLEEKEIAHGLPLDLCMSCGGMWFDSGEMTRYGSHMDGIRPALELAKTTAQPTATPCPRCRQTMNRAWIDDAMVEFKSCPSCNGMWFDGNRLNILRTYHEKKAARAAALAAQPHNPSGRAAVVVVCVTLAATTLGYRAWNRPEKTSAVPSAMTARDYEREALQRKAKGATAERLTHVEEAAEEYEAAAGFYYAAILAASRTDAREAWRLELEYADVGESIARMANRQGLFAEAEKIQKIRLSIFERYKSVLGQAKAWQGLAETSELDRRYDEASRRFDKAASLYRRYGNLPGAKDCTLRSAAARKRG